MWRQPQNRAATRMVPLTGAASYLPAITTTPHAVSRLPILTATPHVEPVVETVPETVEMFTNTDGIVYREKRTRGSFTITVDFHSNGQKQKVAYRDNGLLENFGDEPAVKTFHHDGTVASIEYCVNDGLHRGGDKPALEQFGKNGLLRYREYAINGKIHRTRGAAIESYDVDGALQSESFYLNGKYQNSVTF